MQAFRRLNLKSWMALVVVSAVAVVLSAALNGVHAQNQEEEFLTQAASAPTYYAEFQYATLTGTTNTINATMVPIVTSTGIVYKNLTFQVTAAANGTVTIVSGSPTAVASPTVAASSFRAGTYVGPKFQSGSEYNGMLITVSGPGVVAGGYTDWSLSEAAGATATCPYSTSATWYVGSPTSTNNPLYARLKKVGITSTAYSYGTLGNSSCQPNENWDAGSLIGVSQTGNAITVSTFSQRYSADSNYPLDQITFTLK